MKNARYIAALSVILWTAVVLTGCWDQREIEERASVVSVGIDQVDDDPRLVQITVQIPIPIQIAGSSGGGGTGDPVKVQSATGRTTVEALNNLQKQINQKLFFGHTRVIALGEDIARRGIEDPMDVFRRDPQLRRLLWPLVVKGKASELLKAKPELEQIPTVFIMSMIESGVSTEQIPDINLGGFFIHLSSAVEQPFLNYLVVKGDDIQWSGVAVFKEDKMVGTLDEQETWNLLRLRDGKNGGPIVFEHEGIPDQLLSFQTETSRVDETYRLENGRVKASIKVMIEGDLIGKTFPTDFSKQSEIRKLEQDAERYLEQETKKMISNLQHKYNSDILIIGGKLRAYHTRIWEQVKDTDYFANADISVIYDVKLRRTGMEMQ